LIASTYSEYNGKYCFTNVVPGNYYLWFKLLTTHSFTMIDALGNSRDDLDSNAGPDGKPLVSQSRPVRPISPGIRALPMPAPTPSAISSGMIKPSMACRMPENQAFRA
jgi:hypothetical protein